MALRAERAVVGNALGHEWVRELEQDRRAPGEEKDDLSLQLPAGGLNDTHHDSLTQPFRPPAPHPAIR